MSLFRRVSDKSRLKFHCLELSETELNDIKKLVEENGGEVGEDTEMPVKFMERAKYKSGMYPSYRLYSIEFIRTCVKKSRLVNPHRFRLGPKKLGECCIISCFMYGYCVYENILSSIKIQGTPLIPDSPLNSDNQELENNISLSKHLRNHYFSITHSRLSGRRSLDIDSNETGQSQNPQNQHRIENLRLLVDESQSVISDIYMRALLPWLVNGSDAVTREESTEHNGGNRSCNTECKEVINPKVEELSGHANEFYQQNNSLETLPARSPDTMNSSLETEVEFADVKVEKPDSQEWQPVPKSPESRTKDRAEKSTTLPSVSSAKIRKSSKSNAKASSPSAEVIDEGRRNSITQTTLSNQLPRVISSQVVSPRINLKECEVSLTRASKTPEGNTKYPRLTVIAEAHECLSPVSLNKPKESSSSIASKNVWIREPQSTDSLHSATKYVRRDVKKMVRLRPNAMLDNNENPFNAIKLPNPKYRSNSRKSSLKAKGTSLNDQGSAKVNQTNEKENTTNARSKNPLNADVWNKPGPSGLNTREQRIHGIVSDSSSGEEDAREPKRTEKDVGGRRFVSSSSNSNESDNLANSKTQNNRHDRDSGSKHSDKEQQSRKTLKTNKMKKTTESSKKIFVDESDSYSISTGSDEDRETNVASKSKKHGRVESRRGGVKVSRISSDSESEEKATHIVRKEKAKSYSELDKRHKGVKRNEHRIQDDDSDDSSDESNESRRSSKRPKQEYDSDYLDKREKALQYARNWRSHLQDDRPMKIEATRMPFTKHEQKAIVDYLLTYHNVQKAFPKGLKVWHEMLRRGILPHRTPQSLQNHFVKHLLPHIEDYFDDMSEEHQKQFKALQNTNRN